ncbi:MAG TPA: 3-hydroxyacyl-CoA dehydrogenase NAD-binding domain-containing protein [Gaiellaceae bacterium]|nr:3-hydroxyacyl-CoA dehydrogenase NAD-binding domain-containing protein [Gaiellaceae bacterium]
MLVCVIGAGTMGRGIAAAALAAGLDAVLVDVDRSALAAARTAIERRLEREGAAGRLAALSLATELEAAVAEADVVIEAVPELLDLKRDVFARLRDAAPAGALLATNTSTMSVTALAEACGGSPRVIGLHFFNPVHRMALVEVVVGEATSQAALAEALELAARLGKEPVVVRDVPGFVTSRLGLLLGNEAMRLVEEGVASAPDVDRAMRLGFGHPMGPLELADLVGLDARLNNLRSLHARSGLEQYRPPRILEALVAAGRLGRKSGGGFYDYGDAG